MPLLPLFGWRFALLLVTFANLSNPSPIPHSCAGSSNKHSGSRGDVYLLRPQLPRTQRPEIPVVEETHHPYPTGESFLLPPSLLPASSAEGVSD